MNTTEKSKDLSRFDMPSLVAAYVKLRDTKTELTRQHQEATSKVDENIGLLHKELHTRLAATGVESVKTSEGTVFFKNGRVSRIEDPKAFSAFVLSTGRTDMYQTRVSATAVNEYIEEHSAPPPGVLSEPTRDVSVRRPTKSKA